MIVNSNVLFSKPCTTSTNIHNLQFVIMQTITIEVKLMGHHETIRQKIDSLPHKTLALLALQQSSKPPDTKCPTDTELAKFMQGKLKGRARKQMLTHLYQCHDCYERWMLELRFAEKYPQPAAGFWNKLATSWKELAVFLHLMPPWRLATYVATITVSFILMHNFADKPTNRIDAVLANLSSKKLNMPTKLENHQDDVLALNDSAPLDSKQTYCICLNGAYQVIAGQANTVETPSEHELYCDLGKWVAVLHTVSQNGEQFTHSAFWQQQLLISQDLIERFDNLPKNIVQMMLPEIQQKIQKVAEQPQQATSERISEALPALLEKLNEQQF
jgi:hypothetical protein